MPLKKQPIKYKKERVILSDILPFEIPITFSNRYFYNFLISNQIEIKENKMVWSKNEVEINEIIKLLFGFSGKTIITNSFTIESKELKTIPFNYKICHKENDYRELSLIHPKNQLSIVDFYESNKHSITYNCSVSPFSIRRAEKIAKFTFYKDKLHKNNLSSNHDAETLEEDGKEYESLKTYFVYKEYSNIHKFYESYKYHYCEKKYNHLFKFDISKCFDSIYTHSISWALLNKAIVKENLKSSNETFGGRIDTLMQNMNYGETNGIIIGPEFSRIFAEVILQRIDKSVEYSLYKKGGLIHKVDYEIFRYVDDFFVFYNNDVTRELVLDEFRLHLKDFKLYLNDSKTSVYEKPIVTPQTIAKQKITELFDGNLCYNISQGITSLADELGDLEEIDAVSNISEVIGVIYINSNKLITKFKMILKEASVEYKDILNYSLALIEKKVVRIIKDYNRIVKGRASENSISKALLAIIELTFFLYAVYPRVNTTMRLCRVLRHIVYFVKENNLQNDLKHLLLKSVYDNIYFILQKNKSLKNTQVETLYLLIALGELGKEYWLDAEVLRQYFGINRVEGTGELQISGSLNYFAITVLLFYMKDKKRYLAIQSVIKLYILSKFDNLSPKAIGQNTELVFLLFDCLSCPYLDLPFKRQLLSLHGVSDQALQLKIVNKRKYWFTKWTNFDFGRELDAKHSQEVY